MASFVRILVGTLIIVAGLVVAEAFHVSRSWLDQHLNQVSLAITALALLAAAYAAEVARRAVIQAAQFRDVDRLEDIRDEVEKLRNPTVSVPFSRELSRFGPKELPECWALDKALAGHSLDQALVIAANSELTAKLTSLRRKAYR